MYSTSPAMSEFTRRKFLAGGLTAAALPMATRANAAPVKTAANGVLTILHLTDIHIRPEHDAPARVVKLLRAIRKLHPEVGLVINTGDSIYAADYGNITRERMLEQWKIWEEVVMPELAGLPMIHTIGNHDPWWAGPKDDPMVGMPYVCKRLGIETAHGIRKIGTWNIISLENARGSLDAAQREWLFKTLDELPADAPVMLASHLPLYSLAGDYDGGNMKDSRPIIDKLADRKAPVVALSGHIHIQSSESIWNVDFHCNGALSGSWWEPGKAGDGSYARTPAGYAIVKLHPDGRSVNQYHPLPA